MSVKEWRALFVGIFDEYALEQLQQIQSKSAASQSRSKIVLSIDDSVLRRWGGVLGYLGTWWSGQFKHVVSGQDIVLVTLKIDNCVIPVRMWMMSQKGRYTNRLERVGILLSELGAAWKSKGIDLSKIGLTDSKGRN